MYKVFFKALRALAVLQIIFPQKPVINGLPPTPKVLVEYFYLNHLSIFL